MAVIEVDVIKGFYCTVFHINARCGIENRKLLCNTIAIKHIEDLINQSFYGIEYAS